MAQEYILGVKVDFGMNKSEVLEKIFECIKDNTSEIICTTNSEFVVDAQKDVEFRKIINESYMSLPDSSGIVQARKYLSEVSARLQNCISSKTRSVDSGFIARWCSTPSSTMMRSGSRSRSKHLCSGSLPSKLK